MAWMASSVERRISPKALWNEVRSVVVLAANYGPRDDPLAAVRKRDRAAISIYARNRDYHDVLKGRLKTLAAWLIKSAGEPRAAVKVFVDTAPVLEKPLAERAGVGWQGKHTNLVSRAFGSWLFLAEVFTTLDLPTDADEADHCGRCRACLDICPTQAFLGPYRLDPRRCISYLTIEHRGPIPREFRESLGNRIYGCDDCLAVCPWNKFAQRSREAKFVEREDLAAPPLAELAVLDEAGFRKKFSGSPIKRIGIARFLRNVLIAVGNSGDRTLLTAVNAHLRATHPLVRGAAVWALAQLADRASVVAASRRLLPSEGDAAVADEWAAALTKDWPSERSDRRNATEPS